MAKHSVPDWLRQRAQVTPQRPALLTDAVEWSFAELDERVDAAAHALLQQGVQAGQHVGILAPNGAGFVVAVHALSRLGAVSVPINTRLTPTEIDWQTADADVSLLLTESSVGHLLAAPAAPVDSSDFDL